LECAAVDGALEDAAWCRLWHVPEKRTWSEYLKYLDKYLFYRMKGIS
jgi:hypothetical protein